MIPMAARTAAKAWAPFRSDAGVFLPKLVRVKASLVKNPARRVSCVVFTFDSPRYFYTLANRRLKNNNITTPGVVMLLFVYLRRSSEMYRIDITINTCLYISQVKWVAISFFLLNWYDKK